ncbi:MAG TPA: ABC transporter permease [Clostridiales bacterium]|nr:ABC transporter permease [Clostridiales bacterium]HPV02679.1 ABC transporter permease [Clostridiales bacterium]
MKLKHVMIVLKKEIKDLIRDKRTIISSIVLPMILIPVVNIVMGGGIQKFEKEINENVTVALSQSSNTAEARELVRDRILSKNPNIVLVDTDDPVKALENNEIRCIIELESSYAEKLKEGMPIHITLQYDESKTKSQAAADIVAWAVEEFSEEIIKERITSLGLDPAILQPVNIERVNVAPNEKGNNMMLEMMLPFMIAMLVAIGGIPAATDLVAGEKERNTFEPLLTTMPDRGSLLLGKYFAVTLFSFVSLIAILAGLFIGYMVNPNSLTIGVDAGLEGITLDPLALILALLITVALGMTFSGIQIALSTIAKSYKEAQTYMSFLILATMMPGYATMFIQATDLSPVMFTLPVMNTVAAFKMILGGRIDYFNLVLALVTSIVFVALTLAFAASLFKKEKVMFRN